MKAKDQNQCAAQALDKCSDAVRMICPNVQEAKCYVHWRTGPSPKAGGVARYGLSYFSSREIKLAR